ncbi:MAG: nitrate/nitrite transporter NrtS [Prochlorothrix sp.]|nr:nitrate/nitrite transporter NrtS [Prochlorothrix sp.]
MHVPKAYPKPFSQTAPKAYLPSLVYPPFIATSLRVTAIVGSIVFCINHGPALLQGKMTRGRWTSAALTYMVPYFVSTHGQWSAQRLRLK